MPLPTPLVIIVNGLALADTRVVAETNVLHFFTGRVAGMLPDHGYRIQSSQDGTNWIVRKDASGREGFIYSNLEGTNYQFKLLTLPPSPFGLVESFRVIDVTQ